MSHSVLRIKHPLPPLETDTEDDDDASNVDLRLPVPVSHTTHQRHLSAPPYLLHTLAETCAQTAACASPPTTKQLSHARVPAPSATTPRARHSAKKPVAKPTNYCRPTADSTAVRAVSTSTAQTPQGAAAETCGMKKHLLHKWNVTSMLVPVAPSSPTLGRASCQAKSFRNPAEARYSALTVPPTAIQSTTASQLVRVGRRPEPHQAVSPRATMRDPPKKRPKAPRPGGVRKIRRYPKLLTFDDQGVPISVRAYAAIKAAAVAGATSFITSSERSARISRSPKTVKPSKSPSDTHTSAEQLLRLELEKVKRSASSRYHIKMNLRGRSKLAQWLNATRGDLRAAAAVAFPQLSLDSSLLTNDHAVVRAALSSMRNSPLRVLEALAARLSAKDGKANWAFVLQNLPCKPQTKMTPANSLPAMLATARGEAE